MSELTNIDLFYFVLLAFTVMLYVQKWGELLEMRQYSLYVIVPILWSFVFLLLLQQQSLPFLPLYKGPRLLLSFAQVVVVVLYYLMGRLLFPSPNQLDRSSPFAYLDYYEHFRKQKHLIIGLALVAFGLHIDLYNSCYHFGIGQGLKLFLSSGHTILILACLIIALKAEHKGVLCVLAWILIIFLGKAAFSL